MTTSAHPNILLLMVDQLAAPFLRIYGDPVMQTPAIDRLAAQGVVFRNAYSNSPLCAPARFAMMSGKLNSRIAAYDNASEFPSNIPTVAHHLRAGGYQTSLIGKMHFVGPDQLHGYEERLTTDIYPADFGWTPNWADPDGRFDWWFHNMDSVINAGVAEASNQLDYDDDVGHLAIRKIRDLARTGDDRPWFLTVSFTHPHDPYVARREYWDRYDHHQIPMPTVEKLPESELDPHSQRLRHVISADITEVSEEQIRNARHAYYANTSYVDDFIGEIMATLDRCAMTKNTVVIFTSDHGDMLGERGLWYKMNFFEHASRIPLVVHAPGRLRPTVATTMASLVDIAPTVLDLAGLAADDPSSVDFDGSSLVSYFETADPSRTILGEYLGEGAIAPVLMIRRAHWKFIWSRLDPPQLYNLHADPSERCNLASDPDHQAVVDDFVDEVLVRWDPEGLEAAVLADQGNRAIVDSALRKGRFHPWDFQPSSDAANQYMRNHLDLNEVEAGRRI